MIRPWGYFFKRINFSGCRQEKKVESGCLGWLGGAGLQVLEIQQEIGAASVIELHGYGDVYLFQEAAAFNSDHSSTFDSGELSFFRCQDVSSWKIDFHGMAGAHGCRYGQGNKNSGFAYVGTSAVEESVGLREPDTDGPVEVGTIVLALLEYSLHNANLRKSNSSTYCELSAMLIWTD
jgi:hypothetical protein